MDQSPLNTKIEELFDKLNLTQEERSYMYIVMAEYVGKQMDAIIKEILTEEDFQKLDAIEDENEAEAFISNRFIEETGRKPQQVSDEVLRTYIEKLQIEGIKEMLQRQKHH